MFCTIIKKYKWIFVTEIIDNVKIKDRYGLFIKQLKLVNFDEHISTIVYSNSLKRAIIVIRENNKLYINDLLDQMPSKFEPKIYFNKSTSSNLPPEMVMYYNFLIEYHNQISKIMLDGYTDIAYVSKFWGIKIRNRKIIGDIGNILIVK